MKKIIFVMFVSLLSAMINSSYAGNINTDKTKTRTEVIEELKKARDSGELERYNSETFPHVSKQSSKTRAEVLKELEDYRKTHSAPVSEYY